MDKGRDLVESESGWEVGGRGNGDLPMILCATPAAMADDDPLAGIPLVAMAIRSH